MFRRVAAHLDVLQVLYAALPELRGPGKEVLEEPDVRLAHLRRGRQRQPLRRGDFLLLGGGALLPPLL